MGKLAEQGKPSATVPRKQQFGVGLVLMTSEASLFVKSDLIRNASLAEGRRRVSTEMGYFF